MTRGLYQDEGKGIAYVLLDDAAEPAPIPRSAYEAHGYRPAFRSLPPENLYEAMTKRIVADASSARRVGASGPGRGS